MRKLFLVTFLMAVLSCGCQNEVKEINSLDDLKNARIGVWQSSPYELRAREVLPDAKYVYLYLLSDIVQNLLQHKIDAFVLGKGYVDNIKREGIDIDYLPQSLGDVPLVYTFTKNERGQKLCSQMNEYLAKIEASGEIEELKNKWFNGDEKNKTFQKTVLTGENGTLKICTEGSSPPFIYLREGEIVGYEAEIFNNFCAAYGYNYEVKIGDFVTILLDVSTGKCDVAANAIEKLPEREREMFLSNPNYTEQAVAIINSKSSSSFTFADRIKTSLIDESRWKMIFNGAKMTLFITLGAIIFGTLLGLALYILYHEKIPLVTKIIDMTYRTLQGVPTMVLLLFFYYVVFSSFDISESLIAVLVFSIVLSISVFVMLKSGAESISKGQMEAALSLGFSERRAFIKFILPQVIRNYFLSYQLSLNVILLETSIVGYIAVQDLTKMADLIRARTYDAFVPIITITIVYLLLSKSLMFVTDIISRRINPKNRSREKILNGVKL